MPSNAMLEVLITSIQHALNSVPNTPLQGSPGGYPDTYTLAAALDKFMAIKAQYKRD